MGDARVAAWIASWDAVNNLYTVLEEPRHDRDRDEDIQIMLWNSATLCELSRADHEVGWAAARELGRREEEKKRTRKFIEEALNRGR